jgi:hypothetical protein
MKCVAGGILAGLLFGVLAIVGGTELAAIVAITIALLVTVFGLLDYVEHGGRHRGRHGRHG